MTLSTDLAAEKIFWTAFSKENWPPMSREKRCGWFCERTVIAANMRQITRRRAISKRNEQTNRPELNNASGIRELGGNLVGVAL